MLTCFKNRGILLFFDRLKANYNLKLLIYYFDLCFFGSMLIFNLLLLNINLITQVSNNRKCFEKKIS
jgi:hypothetical protein